MRKIAVLVGVLLVGMLLHGEARAQLQPSAADVVTACGTPNGGAYPANTVRPQTIDINGNNCGAAPSVSVAGVTSTNLSTTIGVTNTFQPIQPATAGRKGCLIQNPDTNSNNQWVFFGALGSATKPLSFLLVPGRPITCAVGGLAVATDQVSITGTAGDSFVASFQ